MTRVWVNLMVLAVLAGCGDSAGGTKDNPFEPDPVETSTPDTATDTGTGTETTTGVEEAEETETTDNAAGIPETLGGNVSGFTLASDGSSLSVISLGIDSSPLEVAYTRNTALDVQNPDGSTAYVAYTIQEDALDRLFVALGNTSADGTSGAFVVGDGGQFNTVEKGGYYQRSGTYSAPVGTATAGSGQVTYAGTYTGITNVGSTSGGQLITPPAGTDVAFLPRETYRTVGQVLLNANFVDNQINGAISQRRLIYPLDSSGATVIPSPTSVIPAPVSGGTDLPSLSLIIATINDQGEYFGNVEVYNQVGQDVGDYGGIFGGVGATSTSGIVSAERHTGIDNAITEHGVFVLSKCGEPGAGDLCSSVAQ